MKLINKNFLGLNAVIGIPQNELAGSVECFFELKGKPEYKIHRLLPKGTSEILFNLGESFYGKRAWPSSENVNKIICKHYLISGVKTSYLDSFAVNNFHCLGIRFKINGINKIFTISPIELTNNDFELDEVISKAAAQNLFERISGCKTAAERFNLLESWLIKQMRCSKNYETPIINTILSKPFLSVNLLEKETGFSRQYLHKKFKDATGISIKKYQTIRRIAEVLSFLHNSPKELTQATYSYRYFDQSHFIKDFKNITGLIPSSYTAAISPGSLDPYIF